MEELFNRLIAIPLNKFSAKVMEFIPNLFSALLILLLGIVAGWLTKVVLKSFFSIIKLDDYSEKSGVKAVLLKSGLQEPFSLLLARLSGGLVVLVFFLAALNSLEFGLIQNLIEGLIRYIPNILVAMVIFLLGYMFGNFLGRAALIAAVNAGMKISAPISRSVRYLVYLIAVSMALEQLGIGRDTVIVSFGIIFSGVVLAFAIAFGLGGKEVAKEYLERRLAGKPPDDDISHL